MEHRVAHDSRSDGGSIGLPAAMPCNSDAATAGAPSAPQTAAEAEFDRVAADYAAQHAASIRLSGESTQFFAEHKARIAQVEAAQRNCRPGRILDFGSGIGASVRPLQRVFPDARIICLDVSSASLELSQAHHSGDVEFHAYDGERIPPAAGGVDLVFVACVFHHIPADRHIGLLRQLKAALSEDGIVILFEHNPWNPATRHAVRNCPFDKDAVLISAPEMRRRMLAAGFTEATLAFRLFFPAALAALRPLERWLTGLPLGAQYSLVAR